MRRQRGRTRLRRGRGRTRLRRGRGRARPWAGLRCGSCGGGRVGHVGRSLGLRCGRPDDRVGESLERLGERASGGTCNSADEQHAGHGSREHCCRAPERARCGSVRRRPHTRSDGGSASVSVPRRDEGSRCLIGAREFRGSTGCAERLCQRSDHHEILLSCLPRRVFCVVVCDNVVVAHSVTPSAALTAMDDRSRRRPRCTSTRTAPLERSMT